MPCIVTNLGEPAPRGKRAWRGALRAAAIALVALQTSGCYLMQAAGGQLDVARRSRPIEEVVREEKTPQSLRERLALVVAAREFAVRELALPDGRSYREYAQLDRPYALWNVVATHEFSLEPRKSCFPITGCVAYRGYFRQADAVDEGRKLRNRGYDVSVGGVATYSTLGHLRDPVFSTMLAWPESRLVNTIFHEMGHEKLYVSGDTAFNEAYATVVADAGLRAWLTSRGNEQELERVATSAVRAKAFSELLRAARIRLAALYARDLDEADMRIEKNREFGRLKFEYSKLRAQWGGYTGYDAWFARALNNADLVAVATYDDCVPGLERELSAAGSIVAFHARAAELGRLTLAQRHAAVCDAAATPAVKPTR